ncbi:MAG: AIR synthase-related protein [Solimonas sp.]
MLEAAANLACAGAEPIAVTDCLNFGNPERPEVFWTFREVVDGIADACMVLDVPVIGGNVSFYNEPEAAGSGRAIKPTPIIGMVGLLRDVGRRGRLGFQVEDVLVVLLGSGEVSLNASLHLAMAQEEDAGRPAQAGLNRAARAIRCVRQGILDGLLISAHDVSDGGLSVALAEACIQGRIGANVTLPPAGAGVKTSSAEACFGEGPGRFIVSVKPEQAPALEGLAKSHRVACRVLGTVGGESLRIRGADGQAPETMELTVRELTDAWESLEV